MTQRPPPKHRGAKRNRTYQSLHDQLRREVEEMRTNPAIKREYERTPPRRNAAPPRRRFVPMRPKNYVSADELRTEQQQHVSGEDRRAEKITDTPGSWWRDL